MSINFTKYVKITSGVGGNNNVAVRKFIPRIFTPNVLVSPRSVLEFPTADDVGLYFGTTSEEYLRAVKYFNYISPSISAPQSISFTRYANAVVPASVYGAKKAFTLANLQAATAGRITFNFGETSVLVVGIDLSASSSLSDAAARIQAALRLNADNRLSNCTVSFDAVASRFIYISSVIDVAVMSFDITQSGTGTGDLAEILGWYEADGAIMIDASPIVSPVDTLINAVNVNNNFGSIIFSTSAALTIEQIIAVAAQNATYNVMFQYYVRVIPANATAWSAALITIAGVGLVYELDTLNEYPELFPASILAATDYTRRNAVINYMYRQRAELTPSVTTNILSDDLDAKRINYYGQTQTAGQLVQFFQNGVLCGLATDPLAMNIYANEMWLKDYIGASIMSLMLSLPQISANAHGRGQVMSVIQDAITQALYNAVISVGKNYTIVQQLYITEMTGDNKAWIQVQNIGYWLDCTIQQSVEPGSQLTIYTANYILIYGKNDAIRKVVGTHILI